MEKQIKCKKYTYPCKRYLFQWPIINKTLIPKITHKTLEKQLNLIKWSEWNCAVTLIHRNLAFSHMKYYNVISCD